MQKSLVSIIVPVYNVEAYLRECLESIIAQTYKNLEVILINDGSTDLSGQICKEYAAKDSRFIIIDKPNGGLSSARNVGMLAAKGEYIYFIDSDDWIHPKMVFDCVNEIEDKNSDFCFFEADSFNESGYNIVQHYHRNNFYSPDIGFATLSKLCQNNEYHSSVPLLFFRKSFLENHKLFFYEGIVYEDILFTFKAFVQASKISHLHHSYYQRRYRGNSIMTSLMTNYKFFSACKVYEELINFCQSQNILLHETARSYLAKYANTILNIYFHLKSHDKKVCKSKFIEIKKNILKNYAFNNTSLRIRCHSYIFWGCYKIFQKTLGCLKWFK